MHLPFQTILYNHSLYRPTDIGFLELGEETSITLRKILAEYVGAPAGKQLENLLKH